MSPESLDEPISKYINHKIMVVSRDLTVSDAAKAMTESKFESALVFEDQRVVGIITNKDILSDVVAKGKDPSKITIKEITRSPLIQIHKNAKVREAIQTMTKHDIRRLIVTDSEKTLGTISRKKIIGDMNNYEIVLPEIEIPEKIKCPYCSSQFDEKKFLFSHINDNHI